MSSAHYRVGQSLSMLSVKQGGQQLSPWERHAVQRKRIPDWAQQVLDLNSQPYVPPVTREAPGLIDAVAALPLAAVGVPQVEGPIAGARMSSKIAPDHLGRAAVVYVRQSTMTQVMGNLESHRRQHDLARSAAGWLRLGDSDRRRSWNGDMSPSLTRCGGIVLGKRSTHPGGDDAPLSLAGVCHGVAHEVHRA